MRRLLAPTTLVAALSLAWPAFGASSDKGSEPKGGSASAATRAGKSAPTEAAPSDGHAAPGTPPSKVKIIKRLGPKSAAAAQDANQPHDSKPASADGHRDARAADTAVPAGKTSAAPKSANANMDAPLTRGEHEPSPEAARTSEHAHTKPVEKGAGRAAAHADDHRTPAHDTEPTGAASRRARRSGKAAPQASAGGHEEAGGESIRSSGGHDTEAGASLRAARMAKRAAGKAPVAAHVAAEAPVAGPSASPRRPVADAHARDAQPPVASPRPPAIGRRAPVAAAARAPKTPPKPTTPWRQLEWSDSWVALDWDSAHWVALSWDGDGTPNGAHMAGAAPVPAPRPPTQQ